MFGLRIWRSTCQPNMSYHLLSKSMPALRRWAMKTEALSYRRGMASNIQDQSGGLRKVIMNNNPARGPLKVPGFGLPVDFEHDSDEDWQRNAFVSYPHGFSSWKEWRTTVKELAMLQLMNIITDKPDWHKKILDPRIVQKWKSEAMGLPDGHFTERTWQYCVEELTRKAESYGKQSFVKALDTTQTIVKADRQWISVGLQERLKQAVQPLLDQPEDGKDWHPGSGGKVLNLVHPSMYPLVYGKSHILPDTDLSLQNCFELGGAVQVLPVTDIVDISDDLGREGYSSGRRELWSTSFQWLPCDIEFDMKESKRAKIASYINNLHPERHRELYTVIEEYIDKALPLWNSVLSHSGGLRICETDFDNEKEHPPSPDWVLDEWYKADPQGREDIKQRVREYLTQPDNPGYYRIPGRVPLDNIDVDDWGIDWKTADETQIESFVYEVLLEKHYRIRKYPQPEPDDHAFFNNWSSGRIPRPPSTPIENNPDGLQVIVKLSSIELTPEKPTYEGGNWHLEGKLNEHIVATAIYYYDVQNTSPSHIRFRKEAFLADEDMDYDHGDHGFIHDVYGVEHIHAGSGTPAVQDIGSLATKDGRMLVFPNTLQHKVESFELQDSSKPGHRRFLVLWLVDPNYRILSTRNVPPQQEDWRKEKLADNMTLHSDCCGQKSLDVKLNPGIMTMSRGEAEAVRLEIVKERTKVMESVEQNFEMYNFCEH